MVELGCPMLEITAEHLQNLISQGHMSEAESGVQVGAELATYHVPAD
jgi:hypothetical protein